MKNGKLTGALVILALLSGAASAGDVSIYGASPGAYRSPYGSTWQKPAYGYYSNSGYLHPRVINSRPYSSFNNSGYGSGYTSYTPGFSTSTYIPSFTSSYGQYGSMNYGSGSYYPRPFAYTQGYQNGFNDGFRSAQQYSPQVRKQIKRGK